MKEFVPLILLLISVNVYALAIEDIEIRPSNVLYSDDVFNVTVKLNGITCDKGVKITVDNYNWTLKKFYKHCNVKEVFSGNWDLKKRPLSPGTHVVRVYILDIWLYPEKSRSITIRVLDKERPTTSTTTTSTTTSSTSTSTSSTTSTTTSSTSTTTSSTTSSLITPTTSTSTSSTTSTSTSTSTTPPTTTIPQDIEKGIVDIIIEYVINFLKLLIRID